MLGAMKKVGLWRTNQHYCDRDSIPDIEADTLDEVRAARHTVPSTGQSHFLVAELRRGEWRTLGLMSPTTGELTSRRDPDRYDRQRSGELTPSWPDGALVDKEHPAVTQWVGKPGSDCG